jgi:hypothetical protein
MKNAVTEVSWVDANQNCLVEEFARLKRRLRSKPEAGAGDETAGVCNEMHPPPAINRLSELFDLSDFEREILLFCAGVEMDSELAALCGEAQGQDQRAYVTFGLAMACLCDPHWSALTPSRPLRRLRMLDVQAGGKLTSAPLRIDERILHYLAGLNVLDPRLESLLRVSPVPEWIAEEHQSLAAHATRLVARYSRYCPLVHLCGDDPLGQEDIAASVARGGGRQLFVVKSGDLPVIGLDLEQFSVLWERESQLVSGALLIQCERSGTFSSVSHLVERLQGLVFLASREAVRLTRGFIRLDANKPEPVAQKQLWQKALGAAAGDLNGTVDDVSEQFRLSARMIFSTSALLASEQGPLQPDDLWNACRALARPKLDNLAQRIVPCASWDDLVLPDPQKQTLHQIASQVRHRMKVYETWGFAAKSTRGLGVSALFTGESGTGKTMATEVLAGELELDLYRIDLSSVVSKYIGETEKNLKQVFDAAEDGGIILLFDEADALFGKRSDVKDSHDRYANIEVSYLLQRMEAYQGLAILTTNLKSALDRAFQRRIRFTVNFPFPDAAQREAIWSRIFPEQTPTRGLDRKRLSQLNVAGGNIRNIALNAAFLAAESGNGTAVEMKHLLRAARLEAEKIERPLSEAEIRGWMA